MTATGAAPSGPRLIVCATVRVLADPQRVEIGGATRVISRAALRERRLVLALIWHRSARPPFQSLLTLLVSSPHDPAFELRVVLAPPKRGSYVQATIIPLSEGPWSTQPSVDVALEVDGLRASDARYELVD